MGSIRLNQPRHLSQISSRPAQTTTQTAIPAANGNKLAKKCVPEKALADDPKASMVPSSAAMASPEHSMLSQNKLSLLQKAGAVLRLPEAALRGL